MLSLCSCRPDPHPSFQDIDQAIDACRKELRQLRKVDKATMNKVIILTQGWTELKDSVTVCFERDTTDNLELLHIFWCLSDSIRNELARIAGLEARTLKDMVLLKRKTCCKVNSELLTKAKVFFYDMDRTHTYPDVRTTIEEYTALMNTTVINDENGLKDFLLKEDRCFRSLMAFLNHIPRSTLDSLSQRTEEVFANASLTSMDTEMLGIYLIMRINRRVIQNAQTCRAAILSLSNLSDEERKNYRYMLLQPFILFDDKSIAVLTEQQVVFLNALAEELPELLVRMDNSGCGRQAVASEINQLAGFFIKSYLITAI